MMRGGMGALARGGGILPPFRCNATPPVRAEGLCTLVNTRLAAARGPLPLIKPCSVRHVFL